MTAATPKRRHTIKKYLGGDTSISSVRNNTHYAVFAKTGGRPLLTGLGRTEAQAWRDHFDLEAARRAGEVQS